MDDKQKKQQNTLFVIIGTHGIRHTGITDTRTILSNMNANYSDMTVKELLDLLTLYRDT